MSNEQENIKDQIDSQKMSNEINTIVNQEIGKEKDLVVSQDAIHVMPHKFLPTSPKKQLSNKQKIILGSIAFIVFLLIVVGSMLLFANLSVSNNQAKTDQNNTNNQVVDQNQNNSEPAKDIVELTGDEKINVDLNILVEALKKYQVDRGIFPDNLAVLMPDYLNELPRNANDTLYEFSSQSNGADFMIVVEFAGTENPNIIGKYKMTKNGLAVYSVDNEIDNNGQNNGGSITPPPPPPPTSNNFDQDADDLSAEEELIFGTNSNDEDTDNDGYKDGTEIVNLYNPLLSNQALIHSSLIVQYSNQTVKYVLLKPKNWLSQAVEANDLEIMFTPDSGTGDFMNISAEVAAANQTLQAWAQSKAGTNTLSALSLGKDAKITALEMQDSDEHTVFAKVNNHFIKFSYHIDTAGSPYFANTFLMMLNSFSLLK